MVVSFNHQMIDRLMLKENSNNFIKFTYLKSPIWSMNTKINVNQVHSQFPMAFFYSSNCFLWRTGTTTFSTEKIFTTFPLLKRYPENQQKKWGIIVTCRFPNNLKPVCQESDSVILLIITTIFKISLKKLQCQQGWRGVFFLSVTWSYECILPWAYLWISHASTGANIRAESG